MTAKEAKQLSNKNLNKDHYNDDGALESCLYQIKKQAMSGSDNVFIYGPPLSLIVQAELKKLGYSLNRSDYNNHKYIKISW